MFVIFHVIIFPCQKHPGSLLEGFTHTQVSTLAVKDNLLVAGGFQGELICKVNVNLLVIGEYQCFLICCE